MNTAIDNGGAPLAGQPSDGIPPQRIPGMHADTDHIAGPDCLQVKLLQRFIDENWIAHRPWGCGS